MKQTQEYALIVAGGKGTRIRSVIPKQFMELNGRPVLLHTLDAFYRYSEKIHVVLVLPGDHLVMWNSICEKFNFKKPVDIQTGGETRFQSVRNGLLQITGDGLVAIHDGVRPLVSEETIAASFRLAGLHGCAVAAVRLKESIRMTDQNTTRAVDRSLYRVIQTPQTFNVALIRKAYETNEDPSLTDDASVADRAGHAISLFEGTYDNIKITTREDFIVAEAFMNKRSAN